MTFYQTTAGFVIPTVTGSISCISSLAIIYIIVRSKSNTTYHRIMFILSFCDMLGSFAIALTTIPMPKDVIYPFAGRSYGTTATCEAQGLAYLIGSAIVVMMNAILNIYYLCTLRYKMKAETFSKFIEPILTVFAIAAPVATIITMLANQGLINPIPYESYCSISSYPIDCNERDDIECIRGGGSNGVAQFFIVFFFAMVTALATLVTSMFLIILTFYKSERSLKRTRAMMKEHVKEDGSPTDGPHSTKKNNKQEEEAGHQESQHNMTKIITSQALMYLGSFVFTWIFVVLINLEGVFSNNHWIQALKLVFQPLQGFFNMLIFIHHKVFNLRRADEDLSVSEALRIIFTASSMMPEMILSRLTIVHEHEFRATFWIRQGNVVFEEDGSREIRERDDVIISDGVSSAPASVGNGHEDHSYINDISFASGTAKSNSGMLPRSSLPEADIEEDSYVDDDLSFSPSRTVNSGWSQF